MRSFRCTVLLLLVMLTATSCSYYRKRPSGTCPASAPVAAAELREPGGLAPTPEGSNLLTPEQIKASQKRKVIYTATLAIKVTNQADARKAIENIIHKQEGLIVVATLEEVTFRVLPERFDSTLNELVALGEVVTREVKSEDVTAQYHDLALRAEVAESSRKRLMELLNKAGAVKDVLEVERDIRRLTEEIETMKGQLRLMQDQVEMATINVKVIQKELKQMPARHRENSIFEWINTVGLDKSLEEVWSGAPLDGEWSLGRLLRGPRFKLDVPEGMLLPAGFVPLEYTGDRLIGATPEDYRLRVSRFELRQDGDINFWSRALIDELRNYRSYTVKAGTPLAMRQAGLNAMAINCENNIANELWAYDVWLVQRADDPRDLYVIEYARQKKAADAAMAEITKAISGMKVR